jgi:membrane protein involved in colicin uptake
MTDAQKAERKAAKQKLEAEQKTDKKEMTDAQKAERKAAKQKLEAERLAVKRQHAGEYDDSSYFHQLDITNVTAKVGGIPFRC